jgi:hypothetical protein
LQFELKLNEVKKMGQYLAIGITTKLGVKKKQVDKAQLTLEQLQEKMQQELYFVPELYEVSEVDNVYYFQLKEAVLSEQLIPFLKTLYPLLYDKPVYYEDILKTLETMPPSEWLEWAESKPEEAFQLDENGACDYLRHGFTDIDVYADCLLLSMEGKISMETYGRQFRFFQYVMLQAFKPFALAGALRVYITG